MDGAGTCREVDFDQLEAIGPPLAEITLYEATGRDYPKGATGLINEGDPRLMLVPMEQQIDAAITQQTSDSAMIEQVLQGMVHEANAEAVERTLAVTHVGFNLFFGQDDRALIS